MNAQSYPKPGAIERIVGRLLTFFVRIGLVRGHFYVLEVRGRRSGTMISLPVDPIEFQGRRYLVCARGNSNWVPMPARQAKSYSSARCDAATMPCANFRPASDRRFSKHISTASQVRCSASSQYRRDRRWKPSMIWRRITQSSSFSQWTRLHPARNQVRDEDRAEFSGMRPLGAGSQDAGQHNLADHSSRRTH